MWLDRTWNVFPAMRMTRYLGTYQAARAPNGRLACGRPAARTSDCRQHTSPFSASQKWSWPLLSVDDKFDTSNKPIDSPSTYLHISFMRAACMRLVRLCRACTYTDEHSSMQNTSMYISIGTLAENSKPWSSESSVDHHHHHHVQCLVRPAR